MKKQKAGILCFLLAFCFISLDIYAQESEITVYNQGFALVKQQRYFDLNRGLNIIKFTEVAKMIDPNSVHFLSLTAPGSTVILEQNYEYDLVNTSKLLSKYIDRKISLISEDDRSYEGILLSFDSDNLVISSPDGLAAISRLGNIRQILFENLPEGFITKPTLVWEIKAAKAGKHLTEVSYLTEGIGWLCEYVAVLGPDDKKLDLDGWVNLVNKSGATYKNARLKLVAGEVKRVIKQERLMDYNVFPAETAEIFTEKPFFEYHIYDLQRKTTLKNNQTKQVSLFNAKNVAVTKKLVFNASEINRGHYKRASRETVKGKVKVKLVFANAAKNHLGLPLPAGNIKVYKEDGDGSIQFIGEDAIDHTSKGEQIKLYVGDAFDVLGERKRTNFKKQRNIMHETYEITISNHKDKAVKVAVQEKLWRYSNWKIIDSSSHWEKTDASTIEFNLKIPANSQKKVSYTVKYWR